MTLQGAILKHNGLNKWLATWEKPNVPVFKPTFVIAQYSSEIVVMGEHPVLGAITVRMSTKSPYDGFVFSEGVLP